MVDENVSGTLLVNAEMFSGQDLGKILMFYKH